MRPKCTSTTGNDKMAPIQPKRRGETLGSFLVFCFASRTFPVISSLSSSPSLFSSLPFLVYSHYTPSAYILYLPKWTPPKNTRSLFSPLIWRTPAGCMVASIAMLASRVSKLATTSSLGGFLLCSLFRWLVTVWYSLGANEMGSL